MWLSHVQRWCTSVSIFQTYYKILQTLNHYNSSKTKENKNLSYRFVAWPKSYQSVREIFCMSICSRVITLCITQLNWIELAVEYCITYFSFIIISKYNSHVSNSNISTIADFRVSILPPSFNVFWKKCDTCW